MVRTNFFGIVMFAGATLCCSVSAQAPADSAKQQELMRKAMEKIMPGPEHEALTSLAGEWQVDITVWPAPGKDPKVSSGRATNRVVLGGRFLESVWSGTMMGMPVENLTILGFDRRMQKFTSVVFDTFGTYYVTAAGERDSASHTVIMKGNEGQAALEHEHDYEFHLALIDRDTYAWSVVFRDPVTSSGTGNFKMMELTFRRSLAD